VSATLQGAFCSVAFPCFCHLVAGFENIHVRLNMTRFSGSILPWPLAMNRENQVFTAHWACIKAAYMPLF
jgi:hypothetical protein